MSWHLHVRHSTSNFGQLVHQDELTHLRLIDPITPTLILFQIFCVTSNVDFVTFSFYLLTTFLQNFMVRDAINSKL